MAKTLGETIRKMNHINKQLDLHPVDTRKTSSQMELSVRLSSKNYNIITYIDTESWNWAKNDNHLNIIIKPMGETFLQSRIVLYIDEQDQALVLAFRDFAGNFQSHVLKPFNIMESVFLGEK